VACLVNTVMKLPVACKSGNFLTFWATWFLKMDSSQYSWLVSVKEIHVNMELYITYRVSFC